jgi:hypothetical protein
LGCVAALGPADVGGEPGACARTTGAESMPATSPIVATHELVVRNIGHLLARVISLTRCKPPSRSVRDGWRSRRFVAVATPFERLASGSSGSSASASLDRSVMVRPRWRLFAPGGRVESLRPGASPPLRRTALEFLGLNE